MAQITVTFDSFEDMKEFAEKFLGTEKVPVSLACSHHFISFSVFGVSISINCLFVRAQTQFILLTLTSSYHIPNYSTTSRYLQRKMLGEKKK